MAAIVTGIVMLVAGLMIGASSGGRQMLRQVLPEGFAEAWLGPESGFELQAEVLDRLEDTYYKEFDAASLADDAIRGMLEGLDDPYTAYFDPQEYAQLLEHTEGTYSGVGMVVELLNDLPTVVSTFKESPAQEAGIQAGDIIVMVNGESIQGLDLDQVVARIKGEAGSTVDMELYRSPASYLTGGVQEEAPGELPADGETIVLSMVRQEIVTPVLESQMLEAEGVRVAYIDFYTFSEGSGQRLREAVRQAIEEQGAQAIILDLRSNGGGLVDESVAVTGVFVEKGAVVTTTHGLHSPQDVLKATGGGYEDVALYVLVGQFTASASEIVSAALQDHDRATIVGSTTFGKGLVQSLRQLSNGGAVKITSAVYLTPSGADINGKGVVPDVEAPDDPDTPEVDETLDRALELIGAGR